MALCVDASVAIAAHLPHPSGPAARQLLADALVAGERLVAPPLLFAETTSVLRRHVHLRAIEHEDATAALDELFALPWSIVQEPTVYLRALDLARRLGHGRAYDVQYLAVAEMENCPVVTLDRGLHESAQVLGIASRLIA